MAFLTILEHSDAICIYTNDVTLKKEIRDYVTEFSGLLLEVEWETEIKLNAANKGFTVIRDNTQRQAYKLASYIVFCCSEAVLSI
jgi:hypothetical protein